MTIAELKHSIDHAMIELASHRRFEEWEMVERLSRFIATNACAIQLEMRADEAGVVRREP